MDKAKYEPCASPYRVEARAKVGAGRRHTISIQAVDEAGNRGEPAIVRFKVLRAPRLRASVARRTVAVALRRHGFARRVVESLHVDCRRRGRTAFACRFSSRFSGYRLTGRGQVRLGSHLSYSFRVTAQGVHFTLTDDNESSRST